MSLAARFSSESKRRTYAVKSARKRRTASSGARSGEGWAAINHEGQGVGTEPIFGPAINLGTRKALSITYETNFSGISERLGRKPLPHKRACRAIID